MSLLENLITADRIVLAGLAAYDQVMERGWDNCAAALAADGLTAEQIDEAKTGHLERLRAGRGNLHRKLWTKALAMIAADPAPDQREA